MSRFVNLTKMFVRLSRTHYSNVTIIMAARTEVSFTKNGLLLTVVQSVGSELPCESDSIKQGCGQ